MTPGRRRLVRGLLLMVTITLAAATVVYLLAFHVVGESGRSQTIAIGALALVCFWGGFLGSFVRAGRRPQIEEPARRR